MAGEKGPGVRSPKTDTQAPWTLFFFLLHLGVKRRKTVIQAISLRKLVGWPMLPRARGPFKFRFDSGLWAKSGFHCSVQGSPVWQHPIPGTPDVLLEPLTINKPLVAYNSSNPERNQSTSTRSDDPLHRTATWHFKVLSHASPHLQLSAVWSRESRTGIIISIMQMRNWISFQVKWSILNDEISLQVLGSFLGLQVPTNFSVVAHLVPTTVWNTWVRKQIKPLI